MVDKIGEIVDVNTVSFSAECFKLNELPNFGGFVKTLDADKSIIAVVNYATTSSIDPGRHPVARGNDNENDEDIFKSNPQLSKLFRSEFTATVLGYIQNNRFYHHLPPKPARIHYSVYNCSFDEILGFTVDLSFLKYLLNSTFEVSTDELVAAVIREAALAYDDQYLFLNRAGQELAKILNNDYQRLQMIINLIRPMEENYG